MFYILFFQISLVCVWGKMRGLRWAVNIAAWEPTERECARSFAAIQASNSRPN
jgi:hypothetical protein